MLTPQSAKAEIRDCLVCGSRTNGVHLGVDVCRACAVFYRRALRKQKQTCRSLCSGGRTLNCSTCRLARLQKIFRTAEKTVVPSPVPVVFCAREDGGIMLASMSGCISKDSYTTQLKIASTRGQHSTPLLARVRTAYEKMCYGRLMGELCARKDTPSPVCISSVKHPVYPATFGTMHHANRLLLACLAEFAVCSFPEFNGLDESEKWAILVKFMYAFGQLVSRIESSCELDKSVYIFVLVRSFAGYALWLSAEIIDHFFDDYDGPKGDAQAAIKLIAHSFDHNYVQDRQIVERLNPKTNSSPSLSSCSGQRENGLSSSDELTRLSDTYRSQVFQELHIYYRDLHRIDCYAGRLGELCLIVPIFERNPDVKETVEVLGLLNI